MGERTFRQLTMNEASIVAEVLRLGCGAPSDAARIAASYEMSDDPSFYPERRLWHLRPMKDAVRIGGDAGVLTATGFDMDDALLSFLLFIKDDGVLKEIEIIREDGEPIISLPDPATLISDDEYRRRQVARAG